MSNNQQAFSPDYQPDDGLGSGVKRTIDIDEGLLGLRPSPSESSYLRTPQGGMMPKIPNDTEKSQVTPQNDYSDQGKGTGRGSGFAINMTKVPQAQLQSTARTPLKPNEHGS